MRQLEQHQENIRNLEARIAALEHCCQARFHLFLWKANERRSDARNVALAGAIVRGAKVSREHNREDNLSVSEYAVSTKAADRLEHRARSGPGASRCLHFCRMCLRR